MALSALILKFSDLWKHFRRSDRSGCTRWEQVSGHDAQRWLVHLLNLYSDAYAPHPVPGAAAVLPLAGRGRAASGPDDPAARLKVSKKLVPVITSEELSALEKTCRARDGCPLDVQAFAAPELVQSAGGHLLDAVQVLLSAGVGPDGQLVCGGVQCELAPRQGDGARIAGVLSVQYRGRLATDVRLHAVSGEAAGSGELGQVPAEPGEICGGVRSPDMCLC